MSQRSSSVDRGKRSFLPQPAAMPSRRRSGSMDNVNFSRKTLLPVAGRPSLAPSSAVQRTAPKPSRPTTGYTTPSRSTTKAPHARYTLSAVRGSGGSAFGAGAARPVVTEADYISSACQRIECYLSKLYMSYQLPKDFRSCPARSSFTEVFMQLACLLDSSVKPEVKMSEEDILKFMKSYGFLQTVPKSSLVVIQKRTWPHVLAMLDYLVDLLSFLDIVTEECESVAFPLTGDRASDHHLAYQMMVLNDVLMPEYVDFMAKPAAQETDSQEEFDRFVKRTTDALESFHNIENVDPDDLKKDCLVLEAELTKQRELADALNTEYQELVGKLSLEHTMQGQLTEEQESLKMKMEGIAERIAEYEAKAAELEKEVAAIQAENDALGVKVAAQPLSHAAATQLRSELRGLREKQREISKGMNSVMQLIEEKKTELNPLLVEFGEHSRVFHDAVLRLFGSKGLTEFGAKSTEITAENVVDWVRTVGSRLNEAAKIKAAEIEASKAAMAKISLEISALNKRKTELEVHLKTAKENHEKASVSRTTELEKLAQVVETAKAQRKAMEKKYREGEKKAAEILSEMKKVNAELDQWEQWAEEAPVLLASVERCIEDAKKAIYEGELQAITDFRDQRKKYIDQVFVDLKEYIDKQVEMDKRMLEKIKGRAREVEEDVRAALEQLAEVPKNAREVMGS